MQSKEKWHMFKHKTFSLNGNKKKKRILHRINEKKNNIIYTNATFLPTRTEPLKTKTLIRLQTTSTTVPTLIQQTFALSISLKKQTSWQKRKLLLDFSLCMMLRTRREANQSAVARQISPDSSCSLHFAYGRCSRHHAGHPAWHRSVGS